MDELLTNFQIAIPNINISGRVVDSDNQPLPFAEIIVKGTTTGTIADENGAFSIINISPNQELIVTFVGKKQQTILANDFAKGGVIKLVGDTDLDPVTVIAIKDDKTRALIAAVLSFAGLYVLGREGDRRQGRGRRGLRGVNRSSNTEVISL